MLPVLLMLRESGAHGAGRPQLASVCRRRRERTVCAQVRGVACALFIIIMGLVVIFRRRAPRRVPGGDGAGAFLQARRHVSAPCPWPVAGSRVHGRTHDPLPRRGRFRAHSDRAGGSRTRPDVSHTSPHGAESTAKSPPGQCNATARQLLRRIATQGPPHSRFCAPPAVDRSRAEAQGCAAHPVEQQRSRLL